MGAKVNASDRDSVVIGTVTHLGIRLATAAQNFGAFSAAMPLKFRLKLPGARDCMQGTAGRGGGGGGSASESISNAGALHGKDTPKTDF